jgi:hypothetical protein
MKQVCSVQRMAALQERPAIDLTRWKQALAKPVVLGVVLPGP